MKFLSNCLIFLLIICLGYVVSTGTNHGSFLFESGMIYSSGHKVTVSFSGGVKNEGEYMVESGTSLHDALYRAGGLEKDADTSMIDFDMLILSDCEIHIPKLVTDITRAEVEYEFSSDSHILKCNINTATSEQISHLPGIGESIAERIVGYREKNGNFSSPDDLLKVKGVGKITLSKIKDYITFGGEKDK